MGEEHIRADGKGTADNRRDAVGTHDRGDATRRHDRGAPIVIMTVARDQPYIYETLASLGPDCPVRLVVGSPDADYLDRYRSRPHVTIVEAAPQEWEAIQGAGLHQRASWNYWRCLTRGGPAQGGLLIFEDDVRFARRWRTRLRQTVRALEAAHGQDFVLALYAPHDFVRDAYHRGQLFAEYPVPWFYGTQGMYFPAGVRAAFAAYLKRNGVDAFRVPYDLLLKDFLTERRVPLFATVPSLVQHTGVQTTGLGSFHQAAGFVEEVEALGPDTVHLQWASYEGNENLGD